MKYGGGSLWDTVAMVKTNDLPVCGRHFQSRQGGKNRKGDNAYTDSIAATHATEGKLGWRHQIVPHDLWDYDPASPLVLFDTDDARGGRCQKLEKAVML